MEPPAHCPRCGGAQFEAIAPNYWECRTPRRSTGGSSSGPNGAIGPNPGAVVCGERFHVGGVVPSVPPICRCGTFAVGLCQTCGLPTCGHHSILQADLRVCRDCRVEELLAPRVERVVAEAKPAVEPAAAPVVAGVDPVDQVDQERRRALRDSLPALSPDELLAVLRDDGELLDGDDIAPFWPKLAAALAPETHEVVGVEVTRRMGGLRWEEVVERILVWEAPNGMIRRGVDTTGIDADDLCDGVISRAGEMWVYNWIEGVTLELTTLEVDRTRFVVPRGTELTPEIVKTRRTIRFPGRLVSSGRAQRVGRCAIAVARAQPFP